MRSSTSWFMEFCDSERLSHFVAPRGASTRFLASGPELSELIPHGHARFCHSERLSHFVAPRGAPTRFLASGPERSEPTPMGMHFTCSRVYVFNRSSTNTIYQFRCYARRPCARCIILRRRACDKIVAYSRRGLVGLSHVMHALHARTARVVECRQRAKDVRAGLLFQITQRLHFGCFRAFLQRLNKVNYLRWHSLLFGCNVSK